jgi:hypothetical protein
LFFAGFDGATAIASQGRDPALKKLGKKTGLHPNLWVSQAVTALDGEKNGHLAWNRFTMFDAIRDHSQSQRFHRN